MKPAVNCDAGIWMLGFVPHERGWLIWSLDSLVSAQNINPVINLAYWNVSNSFMSLPHESADTSAPHGDEDDPVNSLSPMKRVWPYFKYSFQKKRHLTPVYLESTTQLCFFLSSQKLPCPFLLGTKTLGDLKVSVSLPPSLSLTLSLSLCGWGWGWG